MCKPWKKMTKDEKLAYANWKIMKGLGVLVFGVVWMYFAARTVDVWSALPKTLAVTGVLILLYGLFKRASV